MRKVRILLFTILLAVPAVAQNANGNGQAIPGDFTTIAMELSNPPTQVTGVSVQLFGNPGPATYYFWIVADFPIGNSTPAGPFLLQSGPNSFSSSNYAIVTWIPTNGATSYDILMTPTAAAPTGACGCAVAIGLTAYSYNVITNTTSPYTVSTFDPNSCTVNEINIPRTDLSGINKLKYYLPNGNQLGFLDSFGNWSAQSLTAIPTTVSNLPQRTSGGVGTLANIIDGASPTDCGTGGGSLLVTCEYIGGGVWRALIGSGGGGTTGPPYNFAGYNAAGNLGPAPATWDSGVDTINFLGTTNLSLYYFSGATSGLSLFTGTGLNYTISSGVLELLVGSAVILSGSTTGDTFLSPGNSGTGHIVLNQSLFIGAGTNCLETNNAGQVTPSGHPCGNGSIGGLTQNFIPKSNAGGNGLLNSSGFDDGTDYTRWPDGLSTESSGLGQTLPNANPGTVTADPVCVNSARQAFDCGTSNTSGIAGIAVEGAGNSGTVRYCITQCNANFDGPTTINDLAIKSTTTTGLHDTGGTVRVPGVDNFIVNQTIGSAGVASVDILTPRNFSQAQSAVNNIQINGVQTQATADFNGSTPFPDANFIASTYKSANTGTTTNIITEIPYGTNSSKGAVACDGTTTICTAGVVSATAGQVTLGGLVGGFMGTVTTTSGAISMFGYSPTGGDFYSVMPLTGANLGQLCVNTVATADTMPTSLWFATNNNVFPGSFVPPAPDFGRVTIPASAPAGVYCEAPTTSVPAFHIGPGMYGYVAFDTFDNGAHALKVGAWSAQVTNSPSQPLIHEAVSGYSGTIFASPNGNKTGQATEAVTFVALPYAATLQNLWVITGSGQPAGGSAVATLRKTHAGSTSSTSVVVTIPASAGLGSYSDNTHTASFAAGDLMDFQYVDNSGSGTAQFRSVGVEVVPSGGATGMIVFNVGAAPGSGAYTNYIPAWGAGQLVAIVGASPTELQERAVAPRAFKASNLYCVYTTVPGANTTATLIKNGSATALTVTIPTTGSGTQIVSDTTDQVSFSQGDTFDIQFVGTGGASPDVSSCSMQIT